jgi:3-oxoacyl-[acyl-carrier-protein] synthase III
MWPFSKKPEPVPNFLLGDAARAYLVEQSGKASERREALRKKAETPGKKRQYVILTETGQSHVVQSLMDIRSQWLLALYEMENTVTFTDEDGEDSATYRTDFIKGIIVADVTKEKEK